MSRLYRWLIIIVAVTGLLVSGCWLAGNKSSADKGKTGISDNNRNQQAPQQTAPEVRPPQSAAPESTEPRTETPRQTAPEPRPSPSQSYAAYDNTRLAWHFLPKSGRIVPGFGVRHAALARKYKAIYLGNTNNKTVYLTFDEGYEQGYTPQILDTLQANGVKAAFFITLPYLQKQPAIVDRMIREGHIVGNHTVSHPSLPSLSDEMVARELTGLATAYQARTGQSMHYLRPPMGEFSERTLKISSDLGYRNVFWSFAYNDWDTGNQPGADYAYNKVMAGVHNGCVLLLHAVSRDNAQALDRIIKELKAEGYSFGALDQL